MAETITAAVGTSPAPNRFADVETIQSTLNQVPANQGGPNPLLDVDGIVGPLTIAAIRQFQKFHFGWQDGRVDTNNKTMAKLNEFDLDPAEGNSVKFEEFEPNFGFEPADQVRGTAPWQMVPVHGSKLVKIVGGDAVRGVTSNNLNIARPLFLGGAVQIFGVNYGKTLIKLRDANGRVLARLDVSVKRKRTVKVTFHFVQDKTGRRTARTTAKVDDNFASLDDLLKGMNDIWLEQANVEFKLSPMKFRDPHIYSRHDFGDEVRFTAHLPRTGPNAVAAREHEWDIVVGERDFAADFNVFFVVEYEDDVDLTTDTADAGTLASQKSCLCDDQLTGRKLDNNLAHEAGHNMGLPHDGGPNNIMTNGTVDTDRKVTRRQIDRINP